jgi:hypothetical protein
MPVWSGAEWRQAETKPHTSASFPLTIRYTDTPALDVLVHVRNHMRHLKVQPQQVPDLPELPDHICGSTLTASQNPSHGADLEQTSSIHRHVTCLVD